MGKIKEFWSEHKREIVVGTITTIASGVICGYAGRWISLRGDDYKLFREFKSFGTDANGKFLVPKLLKFQEGTNYAASFGCLNDTHKTIPLSKFGDGVKLMIGNNDSIDLDKTMVRGGVLFMHRVDK